MNRADYQRHMIKGEEALDLITGPGAAGNQQSVLLYAATHFLAAIAAVQDPAGGLGEGKIETRGATTHQS